MLAGVGLPRRCLQSADFKIPEDAVRRLLEASAAAADIDDFGLRMAERRALSNLGPLALLVRDQPTVRHAIEAWKQNRKVHTDSVSLRIDECDGSAFIGHVLFVETPLPVRQVVELTVGVLYRTMRLFLGDGWRPRVCFAHSAPRNCDTHRRVFGARSEFNRDFNGIDCCSRDLNTPIPAADPAMARYAQQYIDSISPTNETFGERVRELVSMTLCAGDFRMERTATHLGVDRKTVHRRLAEERNEFLSNRQRGPNRIGAPVYREARTAPMRRRRDAGILGRERVFALVQAPFRL